MIFLMNCLKYDYSFYDIIFSVRILILLNLIRKKDDQNLLTSNFTVIGGFEVEAGVALG